MFLKLFAVLSIYTQLTHGVAIGAIDGEKTEVGVVFALIAGPAPATEVSGIATSASSVGSSRACSEDSSSSPLA